LTNKKFYKYIFSDGTNTEMTPIDALRYSERTGAKILKGPNYHKGRQIKKFDGFGWHDTLKMSFKGPKHYREYLKANNIEEWGDSCPPIYSEKSPPIWTDEMIKRAVDAGIEVGSVLAAALKRGELDFPEVS
jgi:hypothetical protein